MSLHKLGNEQITHYDCKIVRKACIFTVNSSAPAAQRKSEVKWLTPVKPEKNACPVSALFQCSLIRSAATDSATADHEAPPPPPMKNARRASAAGHKTMHPTPPPSTSSSAHSSTYAALKLISIINAPRVHGWHILNHYRY